MEAMTVANPWAVDYNTLTPEEREALKLAEDASRETMRRLHRQVSGPHCKCASCAPLPVAVAYAEATYFRMELQKARRKIAKLEARVAELEPPF